MCAQPLNIQRVSRLQLDSTAQRDQSRDVRRRLNTRRHLHLLHHHNLPSTSETDLTPQRRGTYTLPLVRVPALPPPIPRPASSGRCPLLAKRRRKSCRNVVALPAAASEACSCAEAVSHPGNAIVRVVRRLRMRTSRELCRGVTPHWDETKPRAVRRPVRNPGRSRSALNGWKPVACFCRVLLPCIHVHGRSACLHDL